MKKKTISRLIALALAGVMTLGILTACGDQEDGTGGSSSTPASASGSQSGGQESTGPVPTGDKYDVSATAASNGINLPELDVLEIEVSIPEFNINSEGTFVQLEWEKRMEAYLGCDLEIEWVVTPWADYTANELVVLQSGMISDVATLSKGSAVNEYGEDGLLLDISQYMDYMVYYTDYMEQTNGGPDFAKNEDGSMYYFMDGFYNPDDIQGAQSFTSFAYRFDILQKYGWEPATTIDEFTQLCADMQAKIDSGELDLEYVIINSTKDYGIFRGFVGIWHTWDCLYYNGTEWVFGPIEDNFRDMLAYLNQLWEAGYIDPEFATADSNLATTKATTGVGGICPNLWSGSAAGWNTASTDESMEWGLAYLPEGEYGTAWKWGSRQDGKSLSNTMGIYISAETEHPEHVVAMIDYQYSDQMVHLMNWGIEGETYNVVDGENVFIDEIMNAESPAMTSGEYGLMSASTCRSGIVFNPIEFNAMLDLSSLPEPWWSEEKGYYVGKYWEETSHNGGVESVSPYDRPPIVYLTPEEGTSRAQLAYGGVCTSRASQLAYDFIVGDRDINDDAAWEAYIADIKSQCEDDFDGILQMLNDKTVK